MGKSFSQTDEFNLSEEKNLYTKVENVKVLTTDGQESKLSHFYDKEPLILALIFTRCTGVCSPLIINLKENIQSLNSKSNFHVLVLSFDSLDSRSDVENYAKLFKLNDNNRWTFGITNQIDELIESVGFFPEWDSRTMQFEHDALLVGINGNGYILKKLIGLRNERALENMVESINNKFILSYPLPRNSSILSCFTYDPITGKKKPSFGLLLLILPAVGTILLLAVISRQKKEKGRL